MNGEGFVSPIAALIVLALGGGATAIIGAVRYRDGFNPLTVFCITQVWLYTVFSGAVTYAFIDTAAVTSAVIVQTLGIAGVYLVGVIVPYLAPRDIARRPYATVMRLLGITYGSEVKRVPLCKVLPVCAVGLAAFMIVAVFGGGHALWLTDSRLAYQSYRGGVGAFYAIVQWCLVLTQLYVLWSLRPRLGRLLVITACLLFFAYFLGSKSHLFVVILISALYANFFIKRIPVWMVIAAAPAGLLVHIALQLIQGTAADIVGTIAYFDYFTVTAQFIGRFGEFGYHLGSAWLSSLWGFVPRAVAPEKPYEYGILLIHQVLFPGAAAEGHTPGILAWALPYLDFGVAGVFVSGVITGIWQRSSYEYFLRHRGNVVAFALMVQFSIWGLFAYAPSTIALILCVGFAAYLRVRVPSIRVHTALSYTESRS